MGGSSKSMLLPFNMPPVAKSGILGMLSGAGGGGDGIPFMQKLASVSVTSGDTLDTGASGFEAKQNLMIWCQTVGSGTVHPKLHFNNVSSGSKYAFAYSQSGGSNNTSVNQDYIRTQGGVSGSPTQFSVSSITPNVDGQEKLLFSRVGILQNSGAGSVPTAREDNSGKYITTTSQITRVDMDNAQSGSYASGTHMVVLGCNNDDTSGTNAFEQLASEEIASDGDTFSVTFESKDFLFVTVNVLPNGTGDMTMKFNDSTGNEYAERYSDDYGADSTNNNKAGIDSNFGSLAGNTLATYFISNFASQEKCVLYRYSIADTNASSPPKTLNACGKWENTSDQIEKITMTLGSSHFKAGSTLKVWGFDV